MSESEAESEIVAPHEKPTKHFRSNRFRAKRSRDACGSLQLSDIQDAKFFKGRDAAFIKQVADFAQVEVFAAGEILMREGEEGDKMFFLHRGKVDILLGPTMRKIGTLEAGSVIGELAMMGESKRTATIRAAEFCDCRSLDRHMFGRLLRKFPEERAAFEREARRRVESLKNLRSASEQPRPRSSFMGLPGAGLVEVKHFRQQRFSLLPPDDGQRELSGRRSAPAVLHHEVLAKTGIHHATTAPAGVLDDTATDRTESPLEVGQAHPTKLGQDSVKVEQELTLPPLVPMDSHAPSCKAPKSSSIWPPAPSGALSATATRQKYLLDKFRTANCQLREEVSSLRQNLPGRLQQAC
jgi:CRP-like cAMP-binding protein